jgi:hypothetical protein
LLGYAGNYKEQLKTMDLASGSLSDKEAQLTSLADAELTSFQDQQKEDAKRKLEQKIKDKFKNLF